MSFWFGRIQTGRIFHDISVLLDAFFCTFGRHPDGPRQKKGTFEEQKAFACLHCHCLGKSSKESVSPKLSNAPACPQLSVEMLRPTLMHAKMKEQSAPKNQSKEDRNRGIKHKREPMLWKSFLLRLQSSKTKITPATMSFKLAMWRIS